MSTSSADKGSRYLSQLDQALCNGSWTEIPELARKTEKHAPQRKCYVLAARCEAQLAVTLQFSSPTTTASEQLAKSLDELAANLTEAIGKEQRYAEDAYIARVCLAETRWLREKYKDALESLSEARQPTSSVKGQASSLGWLEVCEVKAEVFRLVGLLESSQDEEAKRLCLNVAARVPGSRTAELRRWTERLLARVCIFMEQQTREPTLYSLSQSLYCFKAWSDFWKRSSDAANSRSGLSAANTRTSIPRRQVWRTYYGLVSSILQRGLLYTVAPTSTTDLLRLPSNDLDEDHIAAQSRQGASLRQVEMSYESLLLQETQFPKASQTNTEVEAFVQQVMSNWTILSSAIWPEEGCGEGGKEGVGRGVLNILYRAATKTYHSTAILRFLFTVHASLGEFDLAMHAFKSYCDIFDKDRLRAEKTGSHEVVFDSDDSAILTAAESIRVLCRYGDREQGEKAVEIGTLIKRWLHEQTTNQSGSTGEARSGDDGMQPAKTSPSKLEASTLGAAYRAIGISQAHWARLTYEAHLRSDLQQQALRNLRNAQTHDPASIETGYALALLLAETRDVTAAIAVLKRTIAASASVEGMERLLLPIWHLLSLCLTAKEGYEQATETCEAAFDQFGEPENLFGNVQRANLEANEKVFRQQSRAGLIEHMEGYEKETLLQIKMSQLTLLELTEGVETAIDSSYELLSLYATLFGSPEFSRPGGNPQQPPTSASTTPSKLGGTLRSVVGSIRPKSMRSSIERDPRTVSAVSITGGKDTAAVRSAPAPKDEQSAGFPIAITVTNENGVATDKSSHHKHFPFHRHGEHGSLRGKGGPKTKRETPEKPSITVAPPVTSNRNGLAYKAEEASFLNEKATTDDTPTSPQQSLTAIPHNIAHNEMPRPPGHEDQPPQQDIRLPAPHPSSKLTLDARLPTAQARQQKISLLVKLWLFIAGLYLRADLLEDAGHAVDEAGTLVESFEVEVSDENANARRFHNKGWGGGKSVDGLWADVWSARGYLAVARKLPFQALENFEQTIAYFPDHADGIIGISNILMDIYEEKIPAEEPRIPLAQKPSSSHPSISTPIPLAPQPPLSATTSSEPKATPDPPRPSTSGRSTRDLSPAELNRLAARDRAYMLLSNLTRLGSGWDNTGAWVTLARSHELSKQISKAKEALWWVVELEENEPMRPWSQVAAGGYTL